MNQSLHRTTTVAALAMSALLVSGTGQATPTYCSAGSPHADGLTLSDVTFRGASADDCFGVQAGNDSGANGAFIGWNGYEQLLSDNAGGAGVSNSWMGVNWSLGGAVSRRAGTFTLTWADPAPVGLPLMLDLIFVTKAANRFAAYLFDGELFRSDQDTATGSWKVSYKNNGGQIPNLSHLSVWARVSPTTRVPEPGTLGLVALGLAGMAMTLARRRVLRA